MVTQVCVFFVAEVLFVGTIDFIAIFLDQIDLHGLLVLGDARVCGVVILV